MACRLANTAILLVWTSGTNFSEILSEIHTFSFKRMNWKMSSVKWGLFRLGLNELTLNLSPPSAAYMRRWTASTLWFVALSAPCHYLNQCSNIANWTLKNKLRWNFDRNLCFFIQRNAFENVVCEMAAILSRERWANYCRDLYDWLNMFISSFLTKYICIKSHTYTENKNNRK